MYLTTSMRAESVFGGRRGLVGTQIVDFPVAIPELERHVVVRPDHRCESSGLRLLRGDG